MYVCHNDFYMLIQIHYQTNRLPASGIRCSKFALCFTLFYCDKKCSSAISVWPIGISKDRIYRIVPVVTCVTDIDVRDSRTNRLWCVDP